MNSNIHIIARRTQLVERLNPAEIAVVELAELRNADIAKIRGVSVSTVKAQMYSAMEKLQVESRTAAWARLAEYRRAA